VIGLGVYELWHLYGPAPFAGTWMNKKSGMALVVERQRALFGDGTYVVWTVTPDAILASQSAWRSDDHLYYRLSTSDPSFAFANSADLRLVGENHLEWSQFGTGNSGIPGTRTLTFTHWSSHTGEASLNTAQNDVRAMLNAGD